MALVRGLALFLPLSAVVTTTENTLLHAPEGVPVEGSNGLLIKVGDRIVPNYAATMVSFEEGDVVTGTVVRIDRDEVLLDITPTPKKDRAKAEPAKPEEEVAAD